MLSRLFSLILPDYCCSCGEIGEIFCASCKYDIEAERSETCLSCRRPISHGDCPTCRLPYSRGWSAGVHRGSLEKLVAVSKFGPSRAGCDMQAALLDTMLPRFAPDMILVPIPTIARHVRERGFGHAERIAHTLAEIRSVRTQMPVRRRTQYVQHGTNRKTRKYQAEHSYELTGVIDERATYVLIDDVLTTGYTVQTVAKLLRDAGARDVWVAVTSRQPLDAKA